MVQGRILLVDLLLIRFKDQRCMGGQDFNLFTFLLFSWLLFKLVCLVFQLKIAIFLKTVVTFLNHENPNSFFLKNNTKNTTNRVPHKIFFICFCDTDVTLGSYWLNCGFCGFIHPIFFNFLIFQFIIQCIVLTKSFSRKSKKKKKKKNKFWCHLCTCKQNQKLVDL